MPTSGMEDNKKNKPQTSSGTIIEALPNTMFKVRLSDNSEIIAYLAGKMRMYRIRVMVGDKVELDLDPYGGKGRISRRL